MTHSHPRRKFLQTTTTGLAALLATPLYSHPKKETPGQLPPFRDDEQYWELVKSQFAIPDGLIMANSANLCSAPHAINQRVAHFANAMSEDVSFQYRAIFDELRQETLQRLAGYFGASIKEIGITRNTTEGNNMVVNGLSMGKGDEVILWDQNHPSNRSTWENRARRDGFTVRSIGVPAAPQNPEELLQPFAEAITKKTRVIAFSHISNVSGLALPAREICTMARENGILTHIDGAQSAGFLDFNLNEVGCDFYTTSAHKWLLGPFENGILYMREEHIANLWPDRITVFWKPENDTVDSKFCLLGQRNETTPPALIDTINFHESIGKDRIEQRIRQMAAFLKDEIKAGIPGVEFVTPRDESLSGGVTIMKIPNKEPREIFETLYRDYRIACAPTGGLRLSPTVSATMADMESIVSALEEIAS